MIEEYDEGKNVWNNTYVVTENTRGGVFGFAREHVLCRVVVAAPSEKILYAAHIDGSKRPIKLSDRIAGHQLFNFRCNENEAGGGILYAQEFWPMIQYLANATKTDTSSKSTERSILGCN
mmetsp:Transcript_40340/g.66068  ORF Transcript_40340/g.66068 Transcript_40340/m.66068 type:complete len:120 (-) Transcript_40340:169-528(-)|eukprot:CAMPEP_0201975960 /NCGR_PEP_ID=MMETSP0904-20121228/55595_1 /ASSEMBLY_ACC=CAM_ASM_000553 /TAXON_ID=420261 /ORGANISM="Thalassiosira antarctica, Strain CCMP982" /LENGTH=119 /DNA_ID=CAMNT_0048526897 /DNA_START=271 /DNA_END=630 /DNA_ORIENTATION=+